LSLTLMPHRSASPPAYSTCMGSLSLSESLSRGRRRGEEGEKAKDRMEERRGRRPGCARTRAAEQACGQRAGPGCTGMVKSGRTPGSPTLDDRRPASARSHDYKAEFACRRLAGRARGNRPAPHRPLGRNRSEGSARASPPAGGRRAIPRPAIGPPILPRARPSPRRRTRSGSRAIRAPAPFTLPRGWVASGASGSLVSAVVTERGLDVA
jgi:hypothetical protein